MKYTKYTILLAIFLVAGSFFLIAEYRKSRIVQSKGLIAKVNYTPNNEVAFSVDGITLTDKQFYDEVKRRPQYINDKVIDQEISEKIERQTDVAI